MDEIFHYPQALKYYKGIYNEWDPKITTPPGLYLFTSAILTPLSKVSTLNIIQLACFRLVNIFFTIGTLYVIYRILQFHHKKDEPRILLLSSFNITIFPLLYFFNFLYYTDCGSTFFVLLMYYWHLKKFYFSASISGAVSLLFRQTNIVWMFYVAAEATLPALLELCKEGIAKKDEDPHAISLSHLKTSMLIVKKNWWQILKKVYEINLGYIPVALASVAFVFYNGSIALGDKKAHEVIPSERIPDSTLKIRIHLLPSLYRIQRHRVFPSMSVTLHKCSGAQPSVDVSVGAFSTSCKINQRTNDLSFRHVYLRTLKKVRHVSTLTLRQGSHLFAAEYWNHA
ncbi:Putative Dol-P-Glc:Glc(2)Man(9)GlcNAc(2)-PP-Dol alpha-1,2-glucosyltransferase [Araneus ventricosus]|uniref:Dol-P-Glc:Glc(2)Man(9)GlcNAc(2)-PP-Dol alpha-1,2-glucosyltransferase n=1 Tax=Araneus ventricosus TaxID=182803 RepID=A0A4Y2DGP3_ARAVE|nr:Putative Dol-P-Glc:Glc(2)Man(9)GlcNAc(2)-PP-Dol alpha-1,2-glucosyltransferase [Araneus ventricosus]